ncbi:MAG: winged helix DNA-binding domain-containing protein, partial [Verrucomicrobiota bacterium]|nr:winged helix DNA-binding domain-containing protein [Verrucomicrobiota bacterium]
RGTVHFVAAQDVHWLLELLTPRILAGALKRAEQIGLDGQTLSRCRALFREALAGGQQLTRAALLGVLEQAGIAIDAHRSYHIIWRLAQERLICFGPRAGKQPTFVWLDDWVPPARPVERTEALRELAVRYFTSHGPATLQDFVWWSGLRISEARKAIESAPLAREMVNGEPAWCGEGAADPATITPSAQLLPAFDEYLLGYKDRSAVLDRAHAIRIVPGRNGIFLPIAVVNGRVVGTWKRIVKSKGAVVTVAPFSGLSVAARKQLRTAADTYADFLSLPVELQFEL